MEVVLVLAKCRILCGLKLIDGELEIDWANLSLFFPDKPYWAQREVNVAGYEEGIITINYPPYGLVQLSIAINSINVDGSLIK